MTSLPRYPGPDDRIPWRWLALCALAELLLIFTAGPRLRGLLSNSLTLAAGTLTLSLPIGTLLAILIAKTNMPGRLWMERLLLTMLLVPLVVQAAAWETVFGLGGWAREPIARLQSSGMAQPWFSGWIGTIWIHAMAAVPWTVLLVGTIIRSVPRELEEDASLAMPAGHVLLRVTLRHALGGAMVAATWIGLVSVGATTVTDLFQVRTFAEEVYTAANLGGEVALWQGTATVALTVLAVLLATSPLWNMRNILSHGSGWRWQMGPGRHLTSVAGWIVVLLLVAVPLASLAWKAGIRVDPIDDHYVCSWSTEQLIRQVAASPGIHRREWGWSLAIGGIAAVLATLLATCIAWMMCRNRVAKFLSLLLLAIGFALPGPVVGVWLIHGFNQPLDSLLRPLTWCYDNTILVPVLAQVFRALPLVTLLIWVRMAAIPQDVLDSSLCDGASWWRQLTWVILPQCWLVIIAAIGVALVLAIGELAATILVVPPGVSTLPVRIFGLLHYGAEDRVAALCLAFWLLVCLLSACIIPLLRPRRD
jgi:iron(III) transport system permease protein